MELIVAANEIKEEVSAGKGKEAVYLVWEVEDPCKELEYCSPTVAPSQNPMFYQSICMWPSKKLRKVNILEKLLPKSLCFHG